MPHILALSCGTLNGNSETLLKAALLSAQRLNPQITFSLLRLSDIHIPNDPKPLSSRADPTKGLVAEIGGDVKGIANALINGVEERDDRREVLDLVLECDALIVAAPTYSHQPPGLLKHLFDKIGGPYADAAFAWQVSEGRKRGEEKYLTMPLDERLLRPRCAAFIMTAGSTADLPEQFGLALPVLNKCVVPFGFRIVDQVVFPGMANPGIVNVEENKGAIKRAEELGRNVVGEIGKTFDDVAYKGEKRDKEGSCPWCHLDKIDIQYASHKGSSNKIICSTCGHEGWLIASSSGTIRPKWDEQSGVSFMSLEGRLKHVEDLQRIGGGEKKMIEERREEYDRERNKWQDVRIPIVRVGKKKGVVEEVQNGLAGMMEKANLA